MTPAIDDSGYDDPSSWGEPTWDESDDEGEYYEDDDEPVTVTCHHCGAEVYEDALQCPICNEYVRAAKDRPFGSRPMLFYVAMALAAIAALSLLISV